MANILIDKNGRLEYLTSVHTGDYVVDKTATQDTIAPLPGVLINPDLTQVRNVDRNYWKVESGQVVEMTPQEKQIVDARLAEEMSEMDNNRYVDIRKLADFLISDLSVPLTKPQIISAIKGKTDLWR